MRKQLENRLQKLKAEFENGQQLLASQEREGQRLRETLLRIGGAIQVLEEELAAIDRQGDDGDARPSS